MFKILEKYLLTNNTHFVLIDAPLIANKAQAGQFVMVRISDKGERIPLTIADYDRQQGTISLVFQEIGKTTCDFAKFKAGDFILDLLGPQGNPTEIKKYGKVVVIGGGIGVAPVFPLARSLKSAGNHVTSIVGFRSKEYIFWQDRMDSVSDELIIATNDGSYGQLGLVTNALQSIIDSAKEIDIIFAIGPAIMMKAVVDIAKIHKIKTIVSLNSLMVCGMGMCGACRVTVEDITKFTCMDGPDFDGANVDFDILLKRLNSYKKEECSCKK
jgi:NAD(P)H-flavin reductase